MPKNLNSFILPDNVIQRMKVDIEDTKRLGVEIGFNLCTKDTSNELQDEKYCKGSSCKLTGWSPGCTSKGKHVGIFHTHTIVPKKSMGESSPSMSDITTAYRYGVMCIGGAGDNKIACIIRKDKTADPKIIKSIRADVEMYEKPFRHVFHITTRKGYEKYLSKLRDLTYTREKLQEKLFNTIEIV